MSQKDTQCYYPDYLQLPTLLDCQKPVSSHRGGPSHDEMLFIVVHQVYELWFKQILHEIKSLQGLFQASYVPEKSIYHAVSKIYRINQIFKILNDQLEIMETMSPQDFLEFRDYLVPASGFQSVQFREIEIRLGLKSHQRTQFDQKSVYYRLKKQDRNYLESIEKERSFYQLLGQWLERVPFLEHDSFRFWDAYQKAVAKMLENDEKIIKNIDHLPPEDLQTQLAGLNITKNCFDTLFDKEKHNELINQNLRQLSHRATVSALFIKLYEEYPIFQSPARLLTGIIDLDELMTTWRYRHSLMAQRMLGNKMGTGGSIGHVYLKKTTVKNRIFADLSNLSTFLISKSMLPELPKGLVHELSFYFNVSFNHQKESPRLKFI